MVFLDFNRSTIAEVKAKMGELSTLMRKKAGLTQGELADELAVSRYTITNLENGKNVTIDTLLKVFRYFGALEKLSSFIEELSEEQQVKALY